MTTTNFYFFFAPLAPFDFTVFLGEDLLLQTIIHVSYIFFDNKNKMNLNIPRKVTSTANAHTFARIAHNERVSFLGEKNPT